MKTPILAALAILPLAALPIAADDASKPKGDGWRTLFDGKATDGWEHVGPGKMVIEDGVMRTEGGMGLLWYTREKLGDCTIRVVYKTATDHSNSGVFVRIADKPKDAWYGVHHGFEVQIDDAGDEFHRTGAVYSMAKATAKPGKVGQWNTLEITLKGPRIEVAVNGEKVTSFNPDTDPIPPRTKDYEPERGPRPHAGYIGLQNHGNEKGSEVYFKEVSVKPL